MPPERPVEFADARRRPPVDLGCAPCFGGYGGQCLQRCVAHAPGQLECSVCGVPVRAAAYGGSGRARVTPEEARAELERRYLPTPREALSALQRRRDTNRLSPAEATRILRARYEPPAG